MKSKLKKSIKKKPGEKGVGIIGASGYTGYELIKILKKHKKVELKVLNSRTYAGKKVSSLYKDFKGSIKFTNYSIDEINDMNLDLVFLAMPHGVAFSIVPKLNCKIVDLGADYRFGNAKEYEKAYKLKHKDKKTKAVYGLPELFKDKIKKAKVVANPGCYVTASLLASLPVKKLAKYIVFDCLSGWSGAGKASSYAKNPKIIKDNIVAYKLTNHRHKYEMEQFLGKKISFTPHAIDTFQGMMSTAHIILKKKVSSKKVKQLFKAFYKNKPFVKVVDSIPDISSTQKSNFCKIGGFEIDENNQLVIISTIDNLIKGASGQAIQNMNLMLGFKENEGLK